MGAWVDEEGVSSAMGGRSGDVAQTWLFLDFYLDHSQVYFLCLLLFWMTRLECNPLVTSLGGILQIRRFKTG